MIQLGGIFAGEVGLVGLCNRRETPGFFNQAKHKNNRKSQPSF
jgi:hypothetical protein